MWHLPPPALPVPPHERKRPGALGGTSSRTLCRAFHKRLMLDGEHLARNYWGLMITLNSLDRMLEDMRWELNETDFPAALQ